MTIIITRDDFEAIHVDRDGHENHVGTQGFDIWFDSIHIHLEDEQDAMEMAKKILDRLGGK